MSEEKQKQLEDNLQISTIEIRSDEVQEILGYIPHWIIRWGISIIFIVVFIFVLGSFFFKYPDVIMSSIVVTTKNPPAPLVARTTGKIGFLPVHDAQKVKTGDIVVILESAANYKDILSLKEELSILEKKRPHFDLSHRLSGTTKYALGEVQSVYANFSKAYDDYASFIRLNFHNAKISALQAQVSRHNILYESTQRQTTIMEQEFSLSKEQYERAGTLLKEGILSRENFDNAKSTFLQKEYALEGARSSLANQKIQISQLEQSIEELQLQFKEQKNQYESALEQAYENLTGQMAQWEQTYLLKTPVDGTVTFTHYWSINQNVKAGDTVVTIVPENTGKMIGKVILPVQGSGKVEINQKVNIKFANYPYVEYGMVIGIIKSKSMVAADNSYVLEVDLPNGLNTSYGEKLTFTQEMQGTAEIITDDIRLSERIFKPIKSILEKM